MAAVSTAQSTCTCSTQTSFYIVLDREEINSALKSQLLFSTVAVELCCVSTELNFTRTQKRFRHRSPKRMTQGSDEYFRLGFWSLLRMNSYGRWNRTNQCCTQCLLSVTATANKPFWVPCDTSKTSRPQDLKTSRPQDLKS